MFYRSLSFCTFFFGHCVVCYFRFTDSDYLPLVSSNSSYPCRASVLNPGFLWGSWCLIVSFICMFCRSLFVLLYFFLWSLCCLLFLDLQILITSLWYLQTLLTLAEHLSSTPGFCGVHGARSLIFCVVFCRSLFLFFFWPLCFLSLDLRIPITPLVSSNSSCPY